jgi:SGNH domain (fused to AT3 domains)
VVLGWRPLQVGGKLSYSWYLWHWPLLVLAPAVAGRPLGMGQNLSLAAASGLLALATVKLVEDPVRFSPRLRARPGRSLALGAGLTTVAVAASVAPASLLPTPHGHGLAAPPATIPMAPPRRTSRAKAQDAAAARLARLSAPVLHAVARAVTVRTVPANLDPPLESAHADQPRPVRDGCLIRWLGVRSGPCAYGSANSRTTVALYGDSHAAQWFPALDRAARARRWRLVTLTKTTCPPVELSLWSPVLGRPSAECDQWRASVLQRIRSERPAVVVLGAARHYGDVYRFQVYGPAWLSGLADTVRQVRATGARVLVLGPTPKPRADVPDCLAEHLRQATACTTPLEAAVNARGIRAERRAVLRAGGSYLDVTPWLCTKATCAVVVGNLLAYRDDNHLSTTYTTWVSPLLAVRLDRPIASGHPARPGRPRASGQAAKRLSHDHPPRAHAAGRSPPG